MSRIAVIGGESRAAVIGGLSCAVVLAVIVWIDPLAEKKKAQLGIIQNTIHGDYDSIVGGRDNDGSGRGGQAHKEIIKSKHFKIYLSNFSC